jgi:hypothetical protein
MNFRPVKTAFGHRFKVPERIQRIDSDSTHGWQLRYGRMPTEFFSDAAHTRAGAAASLDHAVVALHKRVRRFDTALAKAVLLLRDAAVELYSQTKTRAKRRDLAAMQRAT